MPFPRPPLGLTDDALEEWERVAADLEADNRVTNVDAEMLGLYCCAIAGSKRAWAIVEKEGLTVDGYRGSKVKNPAMQVFRDLVATATALAKPLGITPEGRAKLKVETPEPAKPDGAPSYFND